MYDKISYGVERETGMLDYEKIKGTAHRHNPDLVIAGGSAYARAIDFAKFREIADEVGALLMVDMAHIAGLIAAGLHPDPVPHADFVTSTTHKTLRGPRGGLILCKARWRPAIDENIFPGIQGGPLMHVIAAKAVAFKEAMTPQFKEYSGQVIRNAQAMAGELHARGFTIVSGGTDNHLFLVDLNNKDITGKEAEKRLGDVGITVNKNFIPFDERNAYETSGIRIGTPAITTRGMREPEMAFIAQLIEERLCGPQTAAAIKSIRDRVRDLCLGFPVYRMQRRVRVY
jgi:glycine hydroxymethyltransferase